MSALSNDIVSLTIDSDPRFDTRLARRFKASPGLEAMQITLEKSLVKAKLSILSVLAFSAGMIGKEIPTRA